MTDTAGGGRGGAGKKPSLPRLHSGRRHSGDRAVKHGIGGLDAGFTLPWEGCSTGPRGSAAVGLGGRPAAARFARFGAGAAPSAASSSASRLEASRLEASSARLLGDIVNCLRAKLEDGR